MRILKLVLLASFICIVNAVFSVDSISSFPIPGKVNFGGQEIVLDRYDLRERYDREQLVIGYSHSSSLLIIKRANKYFPIIEPILKENGVPDDFKYLAVIESNLDPRAISQVQAAGFWQLMPKTAQELGLEVSDEVDERYHIEKSTVAACKYLKKAYNKYNDWITVAASYNGGMGRISGEIDKQKVGTFFDLLLTSETSRYIFRILAMKQFLENPSSYGYHLTKGDFYPAINTEKVKVNEPVGDWAEWAIAHGITYFQLKDFNIWLRDRNLTNKGRQEYTLDLPKKCDLKCDSTKIQIHNPNWIK
jgi:membrane-bound lytic murein transglycosylase D